MLNYSKKAFAKPNVRSAEKSVKKIDTHFLLNISKRLVIIYQ